MVSRINNRVCVCVSTNIGIVVILLYEGRYVFKENILFTKFFIYLFLMKLNYEKNQFNVCSISGRGRIATYVLVIFIPVPFRLE